MASIEDTLHTLRDVDGVFGSFVISGAGALVARDLPAAFDSELFENVGPRVLRLYETFLSGGEDMDACVLRYADHKLYVRKITWGVVGIISAVAVNMSALRMVSNLVIRRIDPEVSVSSALLTRPSGPPRGASAFTPSPSSTHAPSTPPRPPAPPTRPSVAPATPVSTEPRSLPASERPVRMYRGRPVVD